MDLSEKITQERVENSLKVYKNRSRLVEFPDDVEFISRALREDFKISLSQEDIQMFWWWYSETFFCAGWLLPSSHDVKEGFPRWLSYIEGKEFNDI